MHFIRRQKSDYIGNIFALPDSLQCLPLPWLAPIGAKIERVKV